MNRRTLLTAASGAVLALAGCTNQTESGTESPAETVTATKTAETTTPSAADALVVESSVPVEGTMVNVGVSGTVRNDASSALVDCVVTASGDVGSERYSGEVQRDRLEAGETWEWEVSFGDEADASDDDAVGNIEVETDAAYPESATNG